MRIAADPCFYRRDFLICAICALFLLRSFAAGDALPAEKARGIAPEDLKYYQGGGPLWCKDKSKSFALSRLNDNYCDCPDGTDEPGTSACPEGRFYCRNAGHSPHFLFSSRVNDGICDCCDGSDEYNGRTTCSDTCWESGKKSREKLEKKVSVYKEGAKIRAKDIRHYKHARKQQEGELSSLKKEEKSLKEITQKLKVELEAVEEAERLEREKKAKEEQERKAKEEANKNDTTTAAEEIVPEEVQEVVTNVDSHEADNELSQQVKEGETEHKPEPPAASEVETEPEHSELEPPGVSTEAEQLESKPQLPTEVEVDTESGLEPADDSESEDTDGLSKEELGKRVASRWTGGPSSEREDKGEEKVEEEYDGNDDKDVYSGHDDDDEDDNYDNFGYDSHNYTDSSEKADTSWWQKLRQAPRALLTLLGLKRMHVDASEADRIRSEYRQANNKLNDLQSKISELQKKLKQDFGKEGEFFSLYDQCFERRQQKYVYKVCLYKDSTQEEGHSSTRLGSWEGFLDDYKSIKFQNGDHCWNGPQRSLKVRLRCGLKSELSDIEEPSRCEYAASFWTPAVCYEERAKELQAQLDALRAGAIVPSHDEL
ncbi:glucosidase 2 subunit beta [Selaginella moellendorffii]|uniref:glucosidase 2 subunit beta n=1 Tax=Selaginella moellendorffii TaxID=88036 RepID=UPI000D1C6730|nr:glucosidase 2 subunit beta [Selaginella moellendorffii]|eukprot:XP_024523168.1 glucosidase 2 subunit beta [Selaginella moellendorffii]